MRSSYSENDVTILLKDITGLVEPLPAEIREKYIQSGTHYCEMLPLEYKPGEKYFSLYREALKNYSEITAEAVAVVSEKIRKKNKRTDSSCFSCKGRHTSRNSYKTIS